MQEKQLKDIPGNKLENNIQQFIENYCYELGWLVGIIEGEGTITIAIQKIKGNYHCTPLFTIGQVEKNGMIDEIEKILLKMDIKPKVHYYEKRGIKVIAVHNKKDCMKLARLFEKLPFYGKKKYVVRYWKEALDILVNKEHLTESGFKKLVKIRDNIWKYSSKKYPYRYLSEKYFKNKSRIGINSPLWTEIEIKILKNNYHSKKIHEMMVLLPKRTSGSIQNKAFELGIKRISNKKRIKIDMDEIKKEYLSGLTIKEIADKRDISQNAIWTRLRDNHIPMRKPIRRKRSY